MTIRFLSTYPFRAAAFSLFAALGCGRETTPPTTTPNQQAPSGAPIRVHGTLRGKAVAFECKKLSSIIGDESSAALGADGALLSCVDQPSGFGVSVLVQPVAVGSTTPAGSENGRITATLSNPSEFMTTYAGSTGTITVTAWEPASGRLVGHADIRIEKGSTGQSGMLEILFDVVLAR